MEKIWPALEHVDSSSGALGSSAVNQTLGDLIPIVIDAPADEKTRNSWLDRLWQAMEDGGVDYLSPVGQIRIRVATSTARQRVFPVY